ncbi:MAG TPA: phosphoribosylanthranilate isomerase, partial [Candidatus Saccharimonadales bacterium]|nr:phosphoribosylanthranilate isomerase [Candidatus Saccharimonadales bacterium]
MEIKFCGTRVPRDVSIAKAVGATEVGVIVRPFDEAHQHETWRISHTVDTKQAQHVIQAADENNLTTVLVPRSKDFQTIASMTETLRPSRLQIGEAEDLALTEALHGLPERPSIAQVIHVGAETRPEAADDFLDYVDMIHLDSKGKQPGGNGITHDWEISRGIADRARAAGKAVLLAGGLNSANVAEAIATVQPDGVDVETGIKSVFGA